MIRDSLNINDDCTMDIQIKNGDGEPTYSIAFSRVGRALVIVMGKDGVHRGTLTGKHMNSLNT